MVILALWMVLLIGGGSYGAIFYQNNVYQVDQAASYIDLAAASNNLTEVLKDLNASLAILSQHHGNPNLWFAQPRTNFDLITEQIVATVNSAEKVLNQTPDSYAYQQALKNIQSDLTTTLIGEVQDASSALLWWGFMGWFLLCIVLVIFATAFIWMFTN